VLNWKILRVREARFVEHPSRRFPATIDAPKGQTTRLKVKEEVVSTHRTQPPGHASEETVRPLVYLGGAEGSAPQAQVM